jgi:hypothetical protein
MAESQWAVFSITANGIILSIKNSKLKWGKFYYPPNKSKEIKPATIDQTVIPIGITATIGTCGRSQSWSGTEGSFDLYDGATKIGMYYWNVPFGSNTNASQFTADDNSAGKYLTEVTGGNIQGGALGDVFIVSGKRTP